MTVPVELPSLLDLGRAIRAGETTSEAATERCLAVIRDRDASINAFITVLADAALEAARAADRELGAGRDRGPLHGVPISIKDLFDMAGMATTAASHVRREHVATRDATVVARLREAGAVVVGKTNLHEFALGTTNEESAYGPVHHPLDASRSPGGSSGGSAASVLAGMAYASVGTDTGGSIRIPSAACGLVGLKPRFREVPTSGVVPLSASLDHVGPICATVADAAAIFAVIADASGLDGIPEPAAPRGLRLGVPRRYFLDLLDGDVARAFEVTCARLTAAGVVLDDVEVPHASQIPAAYLHIALTEAAAFHAKTLDSRPDDYTPTVRVRLEAGRYVLAEDYLRALRCRDVLRAEVSAALDGRDGLLLPALAVPATPLGAATVHVSGADEPVRNVTLRLTQLFNLTGHPAITVPCGVTGSGLPIGAQLVGMRTAPLLQTAVTLEPLNPRRAAHILHLVIKGLFHSWEHRLASATKNRIVRPFEWGLDWLALETGGAGRAGEAGRETGEFNGAGADHAGAVVERYVEEVMRDTHAFFTPPPTSDFEFTAADPEQSADGESGTLRFPSALTTPHAENNTVAARWFPSAAARRRGVNGHPPDRGPVVLVLPQWNADAGGHIGLARLLARCGISALRLSLPYHDVRMPAELERADYIVSSNVVRTLQVCRQAVLDARRAVDWLSAQGFERIGILGTSLGSCLSLLTTAHEPRIRAAALNHVSPWFADVVWRGLSTRHVREGLEGHVDLEQLRRIWMPISPMAYLDAMRRTRSLLVYARYDLTFPVELSELLLARFADHGVPHDRFALPCGHYSTGMAPFKFLDAYVLIRFLKRHL